MDGDFVREVCPVIGSRSLLVSSDDGCYTCRYQEVFLLQSQFLTFRRAVVRIEERGDSFHIVSFFHCVAVSAAAESLHIQLFFFRLCLPQSQHVYSLATVAHDRHIVRHSHHCLIVYMLEVDLAVFVRTVYMSSKAHFNGSVGVSDLPRVSMGQPWVRFFLLTLIAYLLFKESESVSGSHAYACDVTECHRVEEACGKSAKTSVTESRVRFQTAKGIQIFSQLCHGFSYHIFYAKIYQVVFEKFSHEEFHGEVVDSLLIVVHVTMLSICVASCRLAADQLGKYFILLLRITILERLSHFVHYFFSVLSDKIVFS